MKLLLAASLYPPEARGPSVFAGQLVEHLRARGWDVAVVKFRDVRGLPPVVRHVVYFFTLLWHGKGAKAVLALDPISTGLPALFAARLLGVPMVLRIGGDYAWEQGRQRMGVTETLDEFTAAPKRRYRLGVRALSALQSFVACRAAKVVAPSRYLSGIAASWGVRSDRTQVIYTVVAGASPSSREQARAKLGFSTEPLVFSLAALVPWKGLPVLVRAVAGLRAHYPALRLVVAGEGVMRQELEALAQSLGFKEKVFIGDIPNADVLQYLRAADVFALNTGYEGLSHVLVEAMHAGAPIVTTDAGGNKELVNDSTALIVPYNDEAAWTEGLRSLFDDKERARALGGAARIFVEKSFAAGSSMQAWEQLLTLI